MTVLYVASDQEGAGKTALCVTLTQKMQKVGLKVAVRKPVAGAGLTADSDPDDGSYARLLAQPAGGRSFDPPDGKAGPDFLGEIKEQIEQASQDADHLIVEGSCGLSREAAKEVVDAVDAKALVVTRYRHGLSAGDLAPWKELFGERLLGFVINGLTRYRAYEATNALLPAMGSEGLVSFGVVPEDRRLLGVSVSRLADHLGGRFITRDDSSEALVEHLMVGGRGMDPGEYYFGLREDKAVIVRGDRPDQQMAALNTPMACMVLTAGIEPIEYVRHEAEQEQVPLIVVQTDTLGTMDALNTLMDGTRFDHPVKLARFSELTEAHVNLPALFDALGVGS